MDKIAAKNMASYGNLIRFLKEPERMLGHLLDNIEKIQLELFNNLRGQGISPQLKMSLSFK